MIIQLSTFPLQFSVLIFLFIVFKTWKRNKTQNQSLKLPPNPPKLPFVGNLHQLISPNPPHQNLAKMGKKLGPIFHLQVGEISTLIISSKELAKEALKIHDLEFAQRPKSLIVEIVNYNGSGLIFSPHGGKWREMRKICAMEFLSTTRVESFKLIREGDAWGLIQSISNSLSHDNVPINLSNMIFGWVSSMVSKAMFGKKYKKVDELLVLFNEVVELEVGLVGESFPSFGLIFYYLSGVRFKMEKRQRRIDEIIEHIISEHKAKRECFEEDESMVEDLVDVLLRLKASGELKYSLTTNNVKGIIVQV